MNKKRATLLATGALVLGLALGTAGVASAATAPTADGARSGTGNGMGASLKGAGARVGDVLAKLAGLSEDQIHELREDGKSLAQIAESEGVDSKTLVSETIAARKTFLDEKVADGTIDSDRAERMIDRMTERVSERVDSTESGKSSWANQDRAGNGDAAHEGDCDEAGPADGKRDEAARGGGGGGRR